MQAVVADRQRQRGVWGNHQGQCRHPQQVGADNASGHQQAGAVLHQLIKGAAAVAKEAGEQQRCQAGSDCGGDGGGEQVGAIELLGGRAHGSHAGVVHGDDAQAEANRRLQVVAWPQFLAAEGIHGHPAGQQHDQQRHPGQGYVVVNFQRCLQGQHADEVHGPDAASQAAGTEQAPLPLGCGQFDVAQAFGHVEGGEAASTGNQECKQHQVGVMPAINQDLSGCRKFGEHF
ncbi:hypothetical protein D3C76_968150 [compost metagenome]